ncbi:hypothetical protein OG369_01890 [Streptomyces sp. NBC_01221]|uniref:hypothetical protein n=1 Tax=unclassified Streptomyces TaxID=2593676 RepID=UPI0022536C75|nr:MULTISPECIES: hypothetical protein [unclassified Streptomyces]WSP53593.1 hypothetical protein OG306_03720 [Streptomyces sp. NBC_01241]WSU25740.1 hypothetical protein OG508_35645 [Streptomyces sp. NBC_01108]MCX4784981.1 hypothetical protein [Streptomyces sp. NBC_01221]MCX4799081.1 hypothetical protein [Streptomyces sp. NBC_01242]WSJ40266.1 hypothetical protein OG772_32610 [Streptomyces sp. NBC_01321]
MAREAMVGLNYGSPKAAAGLAEQARRVAGTSPTAAATLAAAVARWPESGRGPAGW